MRSKESLKRKVRFRIQFRQLFCMVTSKKKIKIRLIIFATRLINKTRAKKL